MSAPLSPETLALVRALIGTLEPTGGVLEPAPTVQAPAPTLRGRALSRALWLARQGTFPWAGEALGQTQAAPKPRPNRAQRRHAKLRALSQTDAETLWEQLALRWDRAPTARTQRTDRADRPARVRLPQSPQSPQSPEAPLSAPSVRRPSLADRARALAEEARTAARARGFGGGDPAQPCTGCGFRPRCTTPCALLTTELPEEEIEAALEVSSPALMAGRGYDEAFMSQPEAEQLWTDADTDEHWPRIVEAFGPRLLDAVEGRVKGQDVFLTMTQRIVVRSLMKGMSRTEINVERGVSRQATCKVVHAALRKLMVIVGMGAVPLPAVRGRKREPSRAESREMVEAAREALDALDGDDDGEWLDTEHTAG